MNRTYSIEIESLRDYILDSIIVESEFKNALAEIEKFNPAAADDRAAADKPGRDRKGILKKVLVANRGEIAKRFFLALHEESITSVAVVTKPDTGQSWYEFADEVVFIGDAGNYADPSVIIAAACFSGANAIYSGYGFLSESSEFVERISTVSRIIKRELIFMGPDFRTMRRVGDKVTARELVSKHDIPLFESSCCFESPDIPAAGAEAARIGYPVIVKLSSGGGGKGMYPVFNADEMEKAVQSAWRIGTELYGNASFYLEKFITRPVHVEVQIFNGNAIGLRKCAVQRRNQKIIEESGHTFLDHYMSLSMLAAAEIIAGISGYAAGGGAGTVEFLIDSDTGKFGFMEMNTRLQVEYAVTDQSLGIDLAKWQILYYDGRGSEIISPELIKYRILERNHAIECRIYAEEPEQNYMPSTGTITTLDLPTFNGIRCDFGFAEGDRILPSYDPMIGKLIAHGATREEALIRMERALQEIYVRGVRTNVGQILRIIRHPAFIKGDYTNALLDEYDELGCSGKNHPAGTNESVLHIDPIVMGGFMEYIKLLHESIQNFAITAAFEGVGDSGWVSGIPWEYRIDYMGEIFKAVYLQTSVDRFHVSVNGISRGTVVLESFKDGDNDYLVKYRNCSLRVRADRFSGLLVLRMKDSVNKINYYRMNVTPVGSGDNGSKGIVRSPFQGTFVAFCGKAPNTGDRIEAGDPLIILSSMKMETTITAPVSGIISHVIGEGETSKLNLGTTPQGRILGKSIREGEILFRIDPDNIEEKNVPSLTGKFNELSESRETIDILMSESFQQKIMSDIDRHLDAMLYLFLAAVRGYIQHPPLSERLVSLMEKIPDDNWKMMINDQRADIINEIIIHYTNIRKLFSPVVYNDGFSFPDELDRYVTIWQNSDIELHPRFRQKTGEILEAYGISSLQWSTHPERIRSMHFFLLLKQSSQFCFTYWKRVGSHVHIVASLAPHLSKTMLALKRLFRHTQTESDDSSHKKIRNIVTTFYPDKAAFFLSPGEEDAHIFTQNSLPLNNNACKKAFTPLCREDVIAPGSISPGYEIFINERILLYAHDLEIEGYSREAEGITLCHLSSEDTSKKKLALFAGIENAADKKQIAAKIERCAEALHKLHRDLSSADKSIELYIDGINFTWSESDNEREIGRKELKQYCAPLAELFYNGALKSCVIRIKIHYSDLTENISCDLTVKMNNDNINFDILSDYNPAQAELPERNISRSGTDKWSIEQWARLSLDPGSMKEIIIPSIEPENAGIPVGSKIYSGNIDGRPVLYYMKDFRINGGATGDLEGRKYCAAAYISGIGGIPLYVWNDSAGANIREGIVSLNRGAEGFMMNSLIAGNTDYDEFLKYVKAVPDPVLRDLFNEIDGMIQFNQCRSSRGRCMLVAVGTGASAGLDVYGSSQATFQILLNSPESYRVLTGSNVIRSVMGENISNYEIGGAQVLGKWAGIVDTVSEDKVDVISQVRQLQDFIGTKKTLPSISRINGVSPGLNKRRGSTIINENDIIANIDNGKFRPLKEDYYGANALIGGMARISGCGVLIMAPRTNSGLTTTDSIIKAKELLKIAYRTGLHQIFIFGRKWNHIRRNHEETSMRSRFDFTKILNNRSGLRINIITSIDGIKEADINGTADIIIFVKNREHSAADSSFISKNTTFAVQNLSAAFDLSGRILSIIESRSLCGSAESAGIPSAPENPAEPYDIISSVIEPAFDKESFIEFCREMNNPVTGPTLVTGLARLEGKTVGIIADQPLTRGGGADTSGTEKFRVFVEFLNRFSIAAIMLSNSSGFVPGSKEERFRIQAVGAESLDANILGKIPVVSVILNQNYGGRLIQAFNGYLRPGIVYIAREKAMMAVLGVNAAFDLLQQKKYKKLVDAGRIDEAENLNINFCIEYSVNATASRDALKTGVIDWLIDDMAKLRVHLSRGLELAEERCNKAFGF